MKKSIIVFTMLATAVVYAFPNPNYYGGGGTMPEFSSQEVRNQLMNCIKHGRVNVCKCTLCGIDGRVMAKTGCHICIKEQHEKNIRVLEEKRIKREAQSLRTSSKHESNPRSNAHYNQNLRIEREQYEYEKSFIQDMTLTNGATGAFSRDEIMLLMGIEEWPFSIVQVISDGKYLARSNFKHIKNGLYLLDYKGSDYVDDDEIKVFGYVSKAKYDYTAINGANKRVRIFVAGSEAFVNLCPMLGDEKLESCNMRIKENYFSDKYVEVTVVRGKSDFARTLPSLDLWVDTIKTFKYFGYKNGSLIQLREEP